MGIRYEIRQGLVHVEILEVLDAAEVFAFYERIAQDPAYAPGMRFLVDVRRVTRVAPFQELRPTALATAQSPVFAVPTRAAALVATPLLFGVVRQWAATSAESLLVTEPFYDEREALDWLLAPDRR